MTADDSLARLAAVIESRKPANGGDPAASYVARLFDKGTDAILKKVGEEATEVVMAGKDGDPKKIVYEVADLWFHSMIALSHFGLSPADVLRELERREGLSGLEEFALRKSQQRDGDSPRLKGRHPMTYDVQTRGAEEPRTLTHVLYALHTITWFSAGIFSVIAIVINMLNFGSLPDDFYRSHWRWQSRTFWFALIAFVLTAPLWVLFVLPGWAAWILIGLWYLYRCVRGWIAFADRRPMPF